MGVLHSRPTLAAELAPGSTTVYRQRRHAGPQPAEAPARPPGPAHIPHSGHALLPHCCAFAARLDDCCHRYRLTAITGTATICWDTQMAGVAGAPLCAS